MHVRNALTLLAGQATAWGATTASQAILARRVGLDALGQFSFLVGLFSLVALVFDWGYGPAASRQVALGAGRTARSAVFSALARVMLVPLVVHGLTSFIAVVLASWALGWDLLGPGLCGAVFGAGFVLRMTVAEAMTGRPGMRGLALVTAAPAAGFLAAVAVLAATGTLNLFTATSLYAAITTTVCLAALGWASKGAVDAAGAVRTLRQAQADFGKDAWIGRVLGTGAFLLDMPLLGLACSSEAVGRYAIAKSICNPFGVLGGNAAKVLYRSMVAVRGIERRLQRRVWMLNLAGGSVLVVSGPLLARCLYGVPAGDLALAMLLQAIAAALVGIYSIYNTYLAAQGEGSALRRGGILFGVLALVLNAALIPAFADVGACLANLLCAGFWLGYCLRAYGISSRGLPHRETGPRPSASSSFRARPLVARRGRPAATRIP